ncbi:dolichol-phosphate mannosyltransferase subunit 3 [Condylostylus longicornis]|uniref:dolichol-phosphate mannosyltransferase subunit 3 n=1 Tax=Condylostylus longicornis TaxID=2530218 RepID=UPI00244E2674|nr:dolichol-phosphate mannosyltransferase subunit 3 [Condylostylus longicornis]
MTNLMRWLLYMSFCLIPYFGIVFEVIRSPILSDWMFEIKILPFVFVILFGLYAIITVLYRTFTFNDCPEAEKEIQEQIIEARIDLISKGFKFRD